MATSRIFFAERGWNAEWKYNRKGLVKNIAIGVAVTSVLLLLLANRKKQHAKNLVEMH